MRWRNEVLSEIYPIVNTAQKCVLPVSFPKWEKHIKRDHDGKKLHNLLTQVPSLRKHFESVHDGKIPLKCNVCSKGLIRQKNLKCCMRTAHEGKICCTQKSTKGNYNTFNLTAWYWKPRDSLTQSLKHTYVYMLLHIILVSPS